MRFGMGWMLVLFGAALISAQDQPKPQPKPQPIKPGNIEPRTAQPRSMAAKKFDDVLDAKDKIVLKHEEEIYSTHSRPTDMEGTQWLHQLRINFIRAKIQGDDSSVVRGIRMTWHVSPVPFVKGSTKDVRLRMDTLGPEEIDTLIRLLEQFEKAINQKEAGFTQATFTTMGLNFLASTNVAEPTVGIYEVDAPVEGHPSGKLWHAQAAKTFLKDLFDALRRAKQKMDE